MIRQPKLGAGVGLLPFPLEYKAVSLLAVGGVLQVPMLVSGVTPEELLDIAHDTRKLWGSPLSRSGPSLPFALALRAPCSRLIGVQVLVACFLKCQLQE